MKKLILLAVLIWFTTMVKAQSQDFYAFKIDAGVGYALPANGSGTEAGATFTLQPHYRLYDDFAVGGRLEIAAIGYKDNSKGDFTVAAIASGCLSGEYYLSDNDFRPFIGAGLGLFDQRTALVNASNNSGPYISARTINLGGYPEIGLEAGHFRVSIEYDVTGTSNNYLAFKIGAFFGGGRKKK